MNNATADWHVGAVARKHAAERVRRDKITTAQRPDVIERVKALVLAGHYPSFIASKLDAIGGDRFVRVRDEWKESAEGRAWFAEHGLTGWPPRPHKLYERKKNYDPNKPALIAAGLGPPKVEPKPDPDQPPKDPAELASWKLRRECDACVRMYRASKWRRAGEART